MVQETINNIVIFNLSKKPMLVTDLVDSNHIRKHVLILFTKLQELGYGKYIIGSRGKGNAAKFLPNKSCPVIYMLNV